MNASTQFETVIGLEVHLQFATNTKIFCGCANEFGQQPNTRTCPICLGLPGTLPVFNQQALQYAMKVALALNCKVNPYIKFDRKNYYYPDLPKGYQISQFDLPIASDGFLMIPSSDNEKKIRIHRAHLEEDAGKLVHDDKLNCSLVDYNRTGTPLFEIVTEPDLSSAQEAYDYLQILKHTLSYLDVSDCDMEKGSLRCDANISIRPVGESALGTKTELKNMNSFKAVKTGLIYEIARHEQVIRSGEKIIQETRLWDEAKGKTASMRSKEEAHDYRYFPEPDLVPFTVDESEIQKARESLPELPQEKLARFIETYSLSDYDARIIIQEKAMAAFFEECLTLSKDAKKIANWMNTSLLRELNNRKMTISQISFKPKDLVDIIENVEKGTISNLAAKEVLAHSIDTGEDIAAIIEEKGLAQVSDDSALETIVDEIIKDNEDVANQIREGKDSAIGFLVGQSMKKTQGKANPKILGDIIRRRLSNE